MAHKWVCSSYKEVAYTDVPTYPLDVLGAETAGMIGYKDPTRTR